MNNTRLAVWLATMGCAVLLVAGCGGVQGDQGDGTGTSQQSENAPGTRIPDGRYVRVATLEDAEAAGLAADQTVITEFGRDGELPMALEFEGDGFRHYLTNDAAVEELGDLGTIDYDDEGRVVFTSESTGCPGCVGTVEWSLDGDTLTLTPVDLPRIDALFVGGEYTRDEG